MIISTSVGTNCLLSRKMRDKTLKGSDIVLILMMDLKKRRNHAEILSEVSQLEGVHYLEEV